MDGIFITARLGSTRLNEKHLIKVAGKTFIEWLIERFCYEFEDELLKGKIKIFITTSVNPENRKFETLIKNPNVIIFYGSDDNIPLRHLECAIKYNIDNIISVDGDDVLCSTYYAKFVLKELANNHTMVSTQGLPLGMNITGYSKKFLEKSLVDNKQKKLETGWGKIFDQSLINYIQIDDYKEAINLRMTLDYEQDANFFKAIINGLKNEIITIKDADLILYIIQQNFSVLNEELNGEYWENFNKQKSEES